VLHHRLEKGTTYNAYIIYGEQFTALVDASHEKFSNLFIATLQEQLKAAGRKIDYVLVRNYSCWTGIRQGLFWRGRVSRAALVPGGGGVSCSFGKVSCSSLGGESSVKGLLNL
jgi:hypothetical protein